MTRAYVPLPRRVAVRYGLMLLAVQLLLLQATVAHAVELRWSSRPFEIVASEKRLADFLRELAASQNTTAVVDPKVDGVISGRFAGPAKNVLDNVTATYGLVWFYDGALLHIELASDTRSEVIPIMPGSAERVAGALSRLGIADRRFPLTVNGNEGTVFVSGPKRYVEIVRQAVGVSDERAAQADRSQLRVFPLRYARAADFRIMRAGQDMSVPGVVSTLRRLHGEPDAASPRGSGGPAALRVGANRQLALRSGETINVPRIELGSANASLASPSADAAARGARPLPQFESDARLNAVIVRDLPERMSQYEGLLRTLDVAPRLVEIELTVMDVSSDRLQDLGIDWRFRGRRADLQVGRGDNPPLSFPSTSTEAGQTGSTTPVGATFTAIAGDAASYLLARVRALSEDGQANFVARPKVLTFDNTEALLENLSEFFVRVAGFQDAQLFNIVTGTAVRVTPQLVDALPAPTPAPGAAPVPPANGASAPPLAATLPSNVVLAIDIQDGSIANQLVDNVPVIRRRAITTQAMVSEGRSLLIAGYSTEETVRATTAVPGLSAIPIVGHLFRSQSDTRTSMERLYMLTPRIVSLHQESTL
jgi:type III secretion protein C